MVEGKSVVRLKIFCDLDLEVWLISLHNIHDLYILDWFNKCYQETGKQENTGMHAAPPQSCRKGQAAQAVLGKNIGPDFPIY